MMVEDEEFVEGEFFREREFVLIGIPVKMGEFLPVSSQLLNMLLHVRPGRWWRGNFSGDGVYPRRLSGEVFSSVLSY